MVCNIFLIIGIVILSVAGLLATKEHRWLRAAEVTEGKVVELIASRGSKGKPTYKPRVEFTGRDGAKHSFVRGYSSNPVGFSVGDVVAVAYDAEYGGRILTFGQRFGFPLVLGAVGLMVYVIAGGLIVGRHYVPHIYMQNDGFVLER